MELNQQTGRETSYLSSLDKEVESLSIEFPTDGEAVNFLGRLTDKNDKYGLPKRYFNCISITLNPEQKDTFYRNFRKELYKKKIPFSEIPFCHDFD